VCRQDSRARLADLDHLPTSARHHPPPLLPRPGWASLPGLLVSVVPLCTLLALGQPERFSRACVAAGRRLGGAAARSWNSIGAADPSWRRRFRPLCSYTSDGWPLWPRPRTLLRSNCRGACQVCPRPLTCFGLASFPPSVLWTMCAPPSSAIPVRWPCFPSQEPPLRQALGPAGGFERRFDSRQTVRSK
jgi:hypothetical protein